MGTAGLLGQPEPPREASEADLCLGSSFSSILLWENALWRKSVFGRTRVTNLALHSAASREYTTECMSYKNHRFWNIRVLPAIFRAIHRGCGGGLLEHAGDLPRIPRSPQTGRTLFGE